MCSCARRRQGQVRWIGIDDGRACAGRVGWLVVRPQARFQGRNELSFWVS
jgi:hypothetical protein